MLEIESYIDGIRIRHAKKKKIVVALRLSHSVWFRFILEKLGFRLFNKRLFESA